VRDVGAWSGDVINGLDWTGLVDLIVPMHAHVHSLCILIFFFLAFLGNGEMGEICVGGLYWMRGRWGGGGGGGGGEIEDMNEIFRSS